MALEIKHQLRQTQQLVMTPQLQQAIKLLQFNHLEMIGALEAELKENPILEAVQEEESLSNEDSTRNDLTALEDMTSEPQIEQPEILEAEWRNYLESYGGDYEKNHGDNRDRMPLENLANQSDSLFDHLLAQLRESELEEEDRKIALDLIGNINDDGYLDIDLATIAASRGIDEDQVERVLSEIQGFEPVGVGARNLQECLLIQARHLDPPNETAIGLLRNHFDLFEKARFDDIVKRMKLPELEVRTAIRVIASLNPKPGKRYNTDGTVYVTPDIYIIKVGNDYSITVNDEGLPRLKISPFYQKKLHSGDCSPTTRDYIHEKMRGAMWLIKSIHQRQRTIYKVTQSILRFQRDFFDKGIDHLKPLILRDVADDIDMHESTVSRVTTNKYVHTPRGTFELKFFFNSGIQQGQDAIASESVKNHIVRIVKDEDAKRPISDKEIVDQLKRFQIHIARRTVAKYREMLGIPSSSRRKKRF